MSDELLSEVRQDTRQILTDLATYAETQKTNSRRIDDHEDRLRLLEAFKWRLVGVGLAAGAVAGVVGALVIKLMERL